MTLNMECSSLGHKPKTNQSQRVILLDNTDVNEAFSDHSENFKFHEREMKKKKKKGFIQDLSHVILPRYQ